jgi:hypothetical protein
MIPDFTVVRESFDRVLEDRRSNIYSLPAIDKLIINTIKGIKGCWIAGGAALALYTGEYNTIKDWDIFLDSPSRWDDVRKIFEDKGFVKTMESDWSVTFNLGGVDLQLVTRYWYKSVADIFRKFDFTVCCFAIEGEDFCYIMDAKNDAMAKKFNFIYTDNLSVCVKRIARYGAKGYFPSNQFTIDIAKAFKKSKMSLIEFGSAKAKDS